MMGTFATADKGIDNTDMIMVDADGRLVIFQVKAMKSVPFYQAIGRVIRMPNDAGKSACGKTAAILSLLKALLAKPRENLGVLKEKKVVKTDALLYYLKRVATWPLYRMQVLLRQALAGSAPVARLILRNRTRHIFITHPPVAPPQAVRVSS